MKSLKIVFASLFLAVGAIAISSFTVKEFKSNAFVVKCYDYTITVNTSLTPSASDFVQAVPFKAVTNWSQTTPPTQSDCLNGTLVCRICFDDANLINGVTFSELLEDLRAQIIANGVSPAHGVAINVTVTGALGTAIVPVTIYKEPVQ